MTSSGTIDWERKHALCLLVISAAYFSYAMFGPHLSPERDIVVYWLIDIIRNVAIPCVVLFVASRACDLSAAKLGLLPLRSFAEAANLIWVSFICTLLLLFVNIFTGSFLRYLLGEYPDLLRTDYSYVENIPKVWPQRGLSVAYHVLTASVVEEIFYRGVLKLVVFGLVAYRRRVIFVGISTIAFAVVHWELGVVPFVASVSSGLLLGILYAKLSDLRPLIAAHAVLNLWAFITV